MKKWIISSFNEITLAAALAFLGDLPITIAVSAHGNPESVRKIYLESCQSCNGPTGKGDSDMAAYLTPSAKTDDELRKIILERRPWTARASFDGACEEAELTDLVAFIRSIGL